MCSADAYSTGYLFLSYDEAKSFVITSKHSICDQKYKCDPYKNRVDGCCRTCPKEFNMENIHLFEKENQEKLSISKIFYDKNKDLTIIEVHGRATDKLIINKEVNSDKYITSGFNKKTNEWIDLILDTPRDKDSIIYYNLYSNSTPNLIDKNKNFHGISGSLVFNFDAKNVFKIVKSIIIHNESHNDLGGESLDSLNFEVINIFFECHVFGTKEDLELYELRLLLKNNQEWLLESFSNNRVAKYSLGQPLAPNDPNLPKLLPREHLINKIHHNLFTEDINFILGKEGVGKSWVTAQSWLLQRWFHLFEQLKAYL